MRASSGAPRKPASSRTTTASDGMPPAAVSNASRHRDAWNASQELPASARDTASAASRPSLVTLPKISPSTVTEHKDSYDNVNKSSHMHQSRGDIVRSGRPAQ